jgi:hypothetical protein
MKDQVLWKDAGWAAVVWVSQKPTKLLLLGKSRRLKD